MADQNSNSSEWPHRIKIDDIDSKPKSFFLSANEDECKNIARRTGVEDIEELGATLNISKDSAGSRLYVEGHMKAKVIQKCVITLEPVAAWIEEDFEAWFADTESALSFAKAKKDQESRKGHAEVEVSEESDDPEPVINGNIEAGELVIQYLSLAINPYPKADGAEYELSDETEKGRTPSNIRKNPFEALKNWKGGGDSSENS